VSELPECLACGACCFSQLPTYVRVMGDDYGRLGERAESLTWFEGNRAYLRMVEGQCAALELDASSAEYRCSTYASRPDVCRELERGSAECAAEREAKAERARLALGRARKPSV
jgi:Fe-S-cluster containining protein